MQVRIGIIAALFLCSLGMYAEAGGVNMYIPAFRSMTTIGPVATPVPVVVDAPLPRDMTQNFDFLVVNSNGGTLPWRVIEETTTMSTPFTLTLMANGEEEETYPLMDHNTFTSTTLFPAPPSQGEGGGSAEFTIRTAEPVELSGLSFDFGSNVLLAGDLITVQALVNGRYETILANAPLASERVSFVPTSAEEWIVSVWYVQPLVIREFRLTEELVEESVTRSLRFLAQPGATYTVYRNPDRYMGIEESESGDLTDKRGVMSVLYPAEMPNPRYDASDRDSDGLKDRVDNCADEANPNQEDINQNGIGDACEDFDRDFVPNPIDNCINLPNAGQQDTDGDGIGDACDGEESRLTERLPWVPWVGMGVAGLVLVGLFAFVAFDARRAKKK